MQTTKIVEYKAFAIGHIGMWHGSGTNTHILRFRTFQLAGSNGKVIKEYRCICQSQMSSGCISGGVRTRVITDLTNISQITCKRCLKRLQDAEFKAKVVAGLKETVFTETSTGFFYN